MSSIVMSGPILGAQQAASAAMRASVQPASSQLPARVHAMARQGEDVGRAQERAVEQVSNTSKQTMSASTTAWSRCSAVFIGEPPSESEDGGPPGAGGDGDIGGCEPEPLGRAVGLRPHRAGDVVESAR